MSLRTPLTCSLALALACGPGVPPLATDGTTDPSSSSPSSTASDPGGTSGTGDAPTGGLPTEPTGVDILFVIDNSSSMARTQRALAASIRHLIDPLEAAGVDYRLAFTTTDYGTHPLCPESEPEGGEFVAASCLDRIGAGEFEFDGQDFASACVDVCDLTGAQIARLPTPLHAQDDAPKPRAWIERIGGVSNLPDGVTSVQAAQCMLPQGVAGCGFEQPLASMHFALGRTALHESENHGFLRDTADLLVVLVTDELDCSFDLNYLSIFTTNKVFWNDPDDPVPTSAVCWRAGTRCTGAAPDWDTCTVADRREDGALSSPDDSVLHPVDRYIDVLAELAAAKQTFGAGRVRLAAITGVPPGWPDAPLVFSDGADPQYLTDHGIGPGCLDLPSDSDFPPRGAVPPLRIREVVASAPLGPGLFSICEGVETVPGTLAALLLP